MKRLVFPIAILITISVILYLGIIVSRSHAYKTSILSPIPSKKTLFASAPSPTPVFLTKPINVLLLGVDGRRGDKNPRCDAIHFFSFDPTLGKILITSVPRGISVNLTNVATPSAYLGNSCHVMGVDFAVSQISKITGLKPDYLVKVGFSQTLGILRTLNFPTTPTLQFLRNRRYGIGDYQRSHNQALFLKQAIIDYLPLFMKLPKPIQYLAYKMLDTDLPFETASQALNQIVISGINKNPNNIELVTKPAPTYKTRDLTFDSNEYASPSSWQNDKEYQTYQSEIIAYLENLVERGNLLLERKQDSAAYSTIKTPFNQQLWLQVEDDKKRHLIHFNMLKIYVLSSPDKNQSSSFLFDFITEMEAYKQDELKKEGEKLLKIIGN